MTIYTKITMDDPATFTDVLTNAIGLTQNRQRLAIIDNGFATAHGLATIGDSALDTLFKTIENQNRYVNNVNQCVNINIMAKEKIKALRAKFIMRSECDAQMVVNELAIMDTNDVDTLGEKHRTWHETKKRASSISLPDIDVPKLVKNNWKTFNQTFIETMSRVRGMNTIPISYVVRSTQVGDYNGAYESTEEQFLNCINLRGSNFNSDKQSVYSLLVQYTKASEAETIVEKYAASRDRRKAFHAVKVHMESTAYMDNICTEAMAKIQVAHYKGEMKEFGIAKYYTIHSNAHNDLDMSGEALSDTMKVTHFISGMKDATAIIYAVMTKAENNAYSFEDFYNSFSAKLTTHITLSSTQNQGTRNISQVDTQGGRGDAGRGRGRGGRDGRGKGRGGRNYHGGYRGGGRGRGRGRENYSAPHWRPQVGNYTDEEWYSLSQEQQQRVRDLRRFSRSQQGSTANIGAAQSQQHDDASIPSQIGGNNSAAVPPGRAGAAFFVSGRGGRGCSTGVERF